MNLETALMVYVYGGGKKAEGLSEIISLVNKEAALGFMPKE